MIQTENSATAVIDIPNLDPSIMAGFSNVSYSGSDNPLCFAGTQVSWIRASSFTVNLVAIPDHIRTRLKGLIEWFIE